MSSPAPQPPLTVAEYEKLPSDPQYRDELSRGRLIREPRPGARHGRVAFEIASALREFVRAHELGSVEMECGFLLNVSDNIVRGPDAAFIARDRLPKKVPVGFWPFAPDLAIEVVSPSNTTSEIESKVLEYLDAGTRMVWVIDPETRVARVYEGNEARIIREHEALSAGEIVPGFSIGLSAILA
ncbi:MAG: Uma2 family endonuclease [Gemmatimonadota bacterium]